MTQPAISNGQSGSSVRTLLNNTVKRWFNVIDYGAVGDGVTNDYAAVAAALTDIYTNKGGVLVFPYKTAGYVLGSSVVIDVGQYAAGAGITVDLGGNKIAPSHAGWCFDVATNFFGANNGGGKPVSFQGGGAVIQTSNLAASGGIRFTDCVRFTVRDVNVVNYNSGSGVQLFISTTNQSTWCEFGLLSNLNLYACLNGIYAKCSNAASGGSFLGCQYEMIIGNGTVNNSKLFNLEGSHNNSVFIGCGGFYNQSSSTGGNGFYLNGTFQGATFISPWIDAAGTQSVATDIVFGANYTTGAPQFATIVNSTWISLPTNWRSKLNVIGPYLTIGTAGSGTVLTGNARETLGAARNYYVATTGSDSNNGLTSGSAFLTAGKAMSTIGTLDFNGFGVQVNLAAGTYTEQVTIPVCTGLTSAGNLTIDGGGVAIIAGTVASQGAIVVAPGTQCTIQNLTVSNAQSSGSGIQVRQAHLILGAGVTFGACTAAQLLANANAFVEGNAALTASGNAAQFILASFGGYISLFCNIAFGTRTYTTTVSSVDGGRVEMSGTYTGTVTAQRYKSNSQSVIETYTGNTGFIPGSTAGDSTGGYYN